jgi:hypothetical protein
MFPYWIPTSTQPQLDFSLTVGQNNNIFVDGNEVAQFIIPLTVFGVPNGAVLTAYGFKGDGFNTNSDIRMNVIAVTRFTNVVGTNLGQAFDIGATALADSVTGLSHTVDYQTTTYYVYLTLDGSSPGGTSPACSLYSIYVAWSLPALVPSGQTVINT